jgi:Autotransporter beta-domain/Cadherin-like beta sandwich domain
VTAQDGTTKTYTTTVTREATPTLTFATPTSASVTMGGSLTNAATSNYSGGSYGTISYTSSATGVATVNSSGVITPVSAGTTTITATQAAVAGVNAQATQTYTLTVSAAASTDANLSAFTISSGTLSPTFASATTSYTASVSNATTSVTVTPTRNQANATITVNGTAVNSGSASGAINLNVGSNTITTVVTAQDGTTTKTYTTTVTREALLSQASFTVSASSTSLVTSGTATLSTSGGSGTGTVTYTVTTGSCVISGVTLTASSSAGSCVVTATKAGDATYSAISATVTITVTAAATRATIAQAATDSSVRATTVAQATAAQRFTGAQIQNLNSHIEVLRSNFKVTTGGLSLGVNQGIAKEWMPIIDKLKEHFLTNKNGSSKQEHLIAAPQNAMYLPDLNGESFQLEPRDGRMKVVDPSIKSDQGILTDEGMTRAKPNTYAMNDLFNKVYQGIAKDEEENSPTWALWSLGNFDFGTIGGNNGTSPTKFSATGITVGLDYQLHKSIIVGAAIGLGFDKTNMDTLGSHINSVQKTISTYGIYQPYKNLFLDGSIGYGSVYFNGARIVTYDASNTSLGMSRTGNSIFSSIGVGYQYVSGNLQYQPFIRTTVSQLNLNSYSESGPSSYALAYGPSTSVSTTTSAGLQGMYDILVDNGKWTPSVKLMVSNNSGSAMTQSAYYADVGAAGGTYYLNSISLPTYTESAGVSLKYSYKRNMSLELGYLGTIGNNSYRANSIRLDARLMF